MVHNLALWKPCKVRVGHLSKTRHLIYLSPGLTSHSLQLDSSLFAQIFHIIHLSLIKSAVVSRCPWTRTMNQMMWILPLRWSTQASSFANGRMFVLVAQVQTGVSLSTYVLHILNDDWYWALLQIPKEFNNGDHLEFQINVVLPRAKSTVDSFMTYLPLFYQSFGDLRSKLVFNRFAVEGATHPISCKVWLFISPWLVALAWYWRRSF